MKKPPVANSGSHVANDFNDPEFKNEYPTLHEYMTCSKWDDGSFRKTSTLLFFVDEGSWKVCLNDRAFNRQAFISSRTHAEALAMLEDGLYTDTIIWRANKPNGKK